MSNRAIFTRDITLYVDAINGQPVYVKCVKGQPVIPAQLDRYRQQLINAEVIKEEKESKPTRTPKKED